MDIDKLKAEIKAAVREAILTASTGASPIDVAMAAIDNVFADFPEHELIYLACKVVM